MRFFTPLILLALTAPTLGHAEEMYQWKDAQGVTHYSDIPPPQDIANERQITVGGSGVSKAPQEEATQASTESAQCATARLNQKLLSDSAPLRQLGADGKPGELLQESDRASQLALANAAVDVYCAKPAPTATP